ncbi:MAG: hypothetical protein ACXADU_03260 [Promethearchaeota archaeon]
MMIFITLDNLTQLSGLFGFLGISISWLFGVIVLIQYIRTRETRLFYFFLSIIFLVSPWYPSGLGYLYWLITAEEIAYQIYVLLGTIGVPIALYSWLQIYMPIMHNKYKTKAIWLITGISIIFYIYLALCVLIIPGAPIEALIGIKRSAIDIDYKGFVLGFLAFSLVISSITGNDIAIASLKAEADPILKWKGRFLFLSFNLFAIGSIGDGFIPLTPVTLIVFRTFIMLSSTFFYAGFILPKWIRKFLSVE